MNFPMRLLSYLTLLFCCTSAASSHPNTVELALMSSIGNTDGLQYFVNLTVGTPGQLQTVFIDTGSSNTFLFASNASFCQTHSCVGGTFDPSKSLTYETTNPGAFSTAFMMRTTWFRGDYMRDTVQIRIMGLGYSSNMPDVIIPRVEKKFPPTFVEGLVQAGAISSRLYSIYLNTLDQYGSILFGGVDTAKYQGPLTTLNFFRTRNTHKVDNIYLNINEIKIEPYNESCRTVFHSTNEYTIRTKPDTGTPDWQLPTSVYQEVIKHAGCEPSEESWPGVPQGKFVRPCSEVARGIANTTHFEVTFAGNGSNTASLRLELADLFSPITTKDGSAATDGSGRPMCWLRVTPRRSKGKLLTSSSVMRAGYWVFDLDNGQVSLAQANLGANSSNVVQVEAGAEGLKEAVHNLKGETQKDKVEGQISPSVTYKLSTATNTVGYATGTESYPTPASTGKYDPSNARSPPRIRNNAHVRRFENTATDVGFQVSGLWLMFVAIAVMGGAIAL
ncbi:acid protease [Aureobasidium sp. EXF-10727]|nr:acid protease [Aureobasidium sp. EXF-10727]